MRKYINTQLRKVHCWEKEYLQGWFPTWRNCLLLSNNMVYTTVYTNKCYKEYELITLYINSIILIHPKRGSQHSEQTVGEVRLKSKSWIVQISYTPQLDRRPVEPVKWYHAIKSNWMPILSVNFPKLFRVRVSQNSAAVLGENPNYERLSRFWKRSSRSLTYSGARTTSLPYRHRCLVHAWSRTRDNHNSRDRRHKLGDSPLDTVIYGVIGFFLFDLITRRVPAATNFPAARLYPYAKRRGVKKIAISDFYVHLRLSTWFRPSNRAQSC